MLPVTPAPAAHAADHAPDPAKNPGNYIYSWFIDRGFTPAAAAGIVGNLKQESNFNPLSNQSGGPGRGLAQWSEGQRWDSLVSWANSQGLNPNHMDTQLQFIVREMRGYGWLDTYRKITDPAQAASFFMNEYERPDPARANEAGRIATAQRWASSDMGNIDVSRGFADPAGSFDYAARESGGSGGSVTQDKLDPQQLAAQAGWEYSFLKTQPELWDLFQQAIKHGWSPERFAAAAKDTDWYKNHSASIRAYQVAKSTDHATWLQDRHDMIENIMDQAGSMGASLNHKQATRLAESAMMFGWQPGDANLNNVLADHIHRVQGSFVGQAGNIEDALAGYANSMGVNVSRDWVKKAVVGISNGDWDQQRAEDHIRRMAMSAFPSFRDDLRDNPTMTMADIASPYLNSYATILEKNPAEVNLMTPAIRQALTMRDGKGKATAQSLWDFETSLRKDPEWAKTKNGTESILSGVQGVLRDFGFGW